MWENFPESISINFYDLYFWVEAWGIWPTPALRCDLLILPKTNPFRRFWLRLRPFAVLAPALTNKAGSGIGNPGFQRVSNSLQPISETNYWIVLTIIIKTYLWIIRLNKTVIITVPKNDRNSARTNSYRTDRKSKEVAQNLLGLTVFYNHRLKSAKRWSTWSRLRQRRGGRR